MPGQKLIDKHHLKILNMEPAGIPSNTSHQQLMGDDGDSSDPSLATSSSNVNIIKDDKDTFSSVSKREWLTIAILCFVNLINYMDRFTVAGILPDIQVEFGINDALAGLLQTAFVLSYMLFAPVFGYLGDRYSRKYIMAFGVFLWSLTTLLGSFMPSYGGFLAFRALVGIGEASYSTIAPTIISDLFVKDLRSKMLALFYFAIPVGSGLGYIVGSQTAVLMGSWHWGLRVTPILGAVAVLLILLVLEDPARGESEGSEHLVATSWGKDLKSLGKNASFMLSTFGFTCVAFVAGALAWWGPKFIHTGLILQAGKGDASLDDVSFKFGIIAMIAGLVGVPLGSFLAQRLRRRHPQADPLLCATGLLLSAPFIYFALILADKSTAGCFLMVFLGEVALNLNWSIVADMLLYVVIPTRRSTAEAFQILLSHALGDAGSPYLIGVISDALSVTLKPPASAATITISALNATAIPSAEVVDPTVAFHSLQYALFLTTFVEVLGGIFFLLTAFYIVRDKKRCDRALAAMNIEIKISSHDDSSLDSDSILLSPYHMPVEKTSPDICTPMKVAPGNQHH